MIKDNFTGEDITPVPAVGSFVVPDGWDLGGHLQPESWEEADFRIPTNNGGPITSLAVKITVTGRSYQWPYGLSGGRWVRVKIEFVGDCEPSTFHKGWMKI